MRTHLPLKNFIESLTELTKVRDTLALDPVLLTLMQHWISIFADQSKAFSMRLLTKRQLVSLMETKNGSTEQTVEVWSQEVYTFLYHYFNQETRQYQSFDAEEGQLHIFPIQHTISHKNAILLLQFDALSSSAIALIEQCLQMFHYYSSLIIENERDSLTGLLNRKTFDQCVSKILLSNFSAEQDFSLHHYLVIFDIDFFKKINDSYGHLIGDEVLLLLSRLMQVTFRDGDLLFRFGGEEFVGVFSCNEETDVVLILNRFQAALAAYKFPQVGQITISIGCAKMLPYVLPNTVLERADEALYYAKNHGRNQICYYEALVDGGLLSKDSTISGEIELF